MSEDYSTLVDDIIKCLKITDNTESCTSSLSKVLDVCKSEDAREPCCELLVEKGVLPLLATNLKTSTFPVVLGANVVAEIAKSDTTRQSCTNTELITALVSLLSASQDLTVLQALRALGNICYENDTGRNLVDKAGGLPALLDILRRYASATTQQGGEVRTVACGFLLNVSNTHAFQISSCDVERPFGVDKLTPGPEAGGVAGDSGSQTEGGVRTITLNLGLDTNAGPTQSIQERLISGGALDILQQYLQIHHSDESVCNMAVLCIDSLVEFDEGRVQSIECGLAVTAGQLLSDKSHSSELKQLVVELLANLAESDQVKEQLAKSAMTQLLLDVIHNYEKADDEDSVTLIKLTSDLIVLLLLADSSQSILYGEGKGLIYKETISWLSSKNTQLQLAGALAMGNFARGDAQCISMVDAGIHNLLLPLLSNADKEPSPPLQHAVFSCLRNLAIPACNKSRLLSAGLLSSVMPYTQSEMSTVQFRLLGLIRLVIDGHEKESTELGSSEQFVQFVVKCCGMEEHSGVKGEATRLLAWLVRHSGGALPVARTYKSCSVLPHLVTMINTQHAVMQSEAIVALTLLTTKALDILVDDLIECKIGEELHKFLTTERIAEIVCNAITLLNVLIKSDKMKTCLKANNIEEDVKQLCSHNEDIVQKAASAVHTLFTEK